jgi:pimeloyl-ACP methyl ester carboxylesterase
LLPQIATPVTIIAGRHDRVVPLANAEFLDQRLPNSRIVTVDAGHFVWEEAPTEYASIIVNSVTTKYTIKSPVGSRSSRQSTRRGLLPRA